MRVSSLRLKRARSSATEVSEEGADGMSVGKWKSNWVLVRANLRDGNGRTGRNGTCDEN